MAANHIPQDGRGSQVDGFVQSLQGLLDAYLPELNADIGVANNAGPQGEPVPGAGELEAILARFAQAYPGEDWRAVVSVWGQWYLRTLWPPLVTGALARGWMPLSEAVAIRLTADDRPALMRFGPAQVFTGPADDLLNELVLAHSAPIIERLAVAGGFSPRVLWNVVGAIMRWTLATLREREADFPLEPGDRLLANQVFRDATPNPLYGTQRAGDSGQRRVCCLRYRIDAMPYCADCPIAGCCH